MKYELKFNKNIVNGIELVSGQEVVNSFFHSFSIENYISLIEGLSKNEGYLGDPKGLILYHEIDEEDIAEGNTFNSDEVLIYNHYIGDETMKYNFFLEICIKYGERMLDVVTGLNKDKLQCSLKLLSKIVPSNQ